MVGTAGATRALGNTQLVDYGIQNEKSDIRVHVCVVVRRLYVYPTQEGAQIVQAGEYRSVPVFTDGIQTALGFLVPPRDIPGCRQVIIPDEIWQESQILTYPEKGYQGEKGEAAVYIAKKALRLGLIPLELSVTEIKDEDLQIKGMDIHIESNVVQVKCDYKGGPRKYGGTGNLFLQVAECNPFGIH